MKESDIQKKLKAMCSMYGFLIKISDRYTSGIPDYAWIVNGQTVWIETKAPGEKLRPIQMFFKNRIEAEGCPHVVISDIDQIESMIRRYVA